MGSLLTDYSHKKAEMEAQAASRPLLPEEHWLYQELSYRVFVLEAMAFLEATAPQSCDEEQIRAHYIAMDALICHVLCERRYAPSGDERVEKTRSTAAAALGMIQQDYRRRFSAYMAEQDGDYAADVRRVIATVLPAWKQYRNTLLDISERK